MRGQVNIIGDFSESELDIKSKENTGSVGLIKNSIQAELFEQEIKRWNFGDIETEIFYDKDERQRTHASHRHLQFSQRYVMSSESGHRFETGRR